MDARERLKKYLEHRRDMGESELVLDSLTVEEALRILARPTIKSDAPHADPPTPVRDWRQELRAAEGARGTASASRAEPSPMPMSKPVVDQAPIERRASSSSDSDTAGAPPGLIVGGSGRELFGGPLADLGSLDDVARVVQQCTRCPLYATATNAVPGEGPTTAEVMVIGEAPGANEDATGRPFVGAAGQLLTKILAAVEWRREDVFICNVLKHRPPGNRNPEADEVAACSPYLTRQIEIIQPKVILALGTFAAQTLLATKLSIGKLRGQVHRYHGVPLIVTYHPAALLRNPGWKRPTWEDVQLARRVLDRAARGA